MNSIDLLKFSILLTAILFMKFVAVTVIKDNKMNKLVTIYINSKRKELQYDFCNKTDCLHIGLCFSVPEIYKF